MPVKAPLHTNGYNDTSSYVWGIVDCKKAKDIIGLVAYNVFMDGLFLGRVESDRVETQYNSGGVKWCTHTSEATRWTAEPVLRRMDANGHMWSSRADHATRRDALAELLGIAESRGIIAVAEKDGEKTLAVTDAGRERIGTSGNIPLDEDPRWAA